MIKETASPIKDINKINNFADALDYQAYHNKNKTAFIFLEDGEINESKLTYYELQQKALGIAAKLQSITRKGDRVLLLYISGLDYIEAFYACLYAGIIAVPVYPPDVTSLQRSLKRLSFIIEDASPAAVLSTSQIFNLSKNIPDNEAIPKNMEWINTDVLDSTSTNELSSLKPHDNSIAFLQYTSGSTNNPRGVIISHDNIINNLKYVKNAIGLSPNDKSVLWLPFFHDMGLINGLLQPVFSGYLSILMSPISFLQKPFRWLQAISKYRATYCGGPAFGYKLCSSRITSEQKKNLDLSTWRCAYIGAEPIQKSDLDIFYEKFSSHGFNSESLYPAYGLAEATVAVSGGLVDKQPVCLEIDSGYFENNIIKSPDSISTAKQLVSCGISWPGMNIKIVDPASFIEMKSENIGEIWVSGPSVAQGYWNNSMDTDYSFNAYLNDTKEGPFLRTGDMGFFKNDELYVTGRLKDIIIINGKNHYPQDIELTMERCHSSIRTGCTAAFSIEKEKEEKLVVVCEIKDNYCDINQIRSSIIKAISKNHSLSLYDIVLIKAKTIFKTSSGKIQRNACKQAYLKDHYDLIENPIIDEENNSSSKNIQLNEIIEYLKIKISNFSSISSFEIETDTHINSSGIDSIDAVEIAAMIEEKFGVIVEVSNFFEDITIGDIAQIILEKSISDSDKNVFTYQSNKIPFFPGDKHYTDTAINSRLKWVEDSSKIKLHHIRKSIFNSNSSDLAGNIENYIGSVQIPIGVAGPISINGSHASGYIPVPIATTEGALISSFTRGAMLCNYSGGVNVHVNKQQMLRAPVFFCKDLHGTIMLEKWIKQNYDKIKTRAESASSVAKLTQINTQVFGDSLHVQFYYTTGDAAGQNMTTSCTRVACNWIVEEIENDPSINFIDYYIEGNMSGDKKVNFQNLIVGRGVNVTASIYIPRIILQKTLRVTVESYLRGLNSGVYSSMQTGMMSFNVNFANIIAGIFTSTGQDIACVHESSTGTFNAREKDDGILFNVHLPSLVIGTIGGGTGLPTQKECLEIMGCYGQGKIFKLAEIIAASCMALDISTSTAIAANEFVKAHERFGRNRPVCGIKKKDIKNNFFTDIIEDKKSKVVYFENQCLETDSGYITRRLKNQSDEFIGLYKYNLTINNGSNNKELPVVLKLKTNDLEIINLGIDLACLSGEDRLPGLFEAQSKIFGFNNSHIREIEFYKNIKNEMLCYCPKIYGTLRNDIRQSFAILMEDISEFSHINTVNSPHEWKSAEIEIVLNDMSIMHSFYFNKYNEIPESIFINTLDENIYSDASTFLNELTAFNKNRYPELFTDDLNDCYSNFIENIYNNIKKMNNYHKTITHNDFNTRNICLRKTDSHTKLVVYDWELACYQNPQHDLIEFLVYVLSEKESIEVYDQYIELYFDKLNKHCKLNLDKSEFDEILLLNAIEFAVIRCNLYLLAHNVLKFKFIERVYNNLKRFILYRIG